MRLLRPLQHEEGRQEAVYAFENAMLTHAYSLGRVDALTTFKLADKLVPDTNGPQRRANNVSAQWDHLGTDGSTDKAFKTASGLADPGKLKLAPPPAPPTKSFKPVATQGADLSPKPPAPPEFKPPTLKAPTTPKAPAATAAPSAKPIGDTAPQLGKQILGANIAEGVAKSQKLSEFHLRGVSPSAATPPQESKPGKIEADNGTRRLGTNFSVAKRGVPDAINASFNNLNPQNNSDGTFPINANNEGLIPFPGAGSP